MYALFNKSIKLDVDCKTKGVMIKIEIIKKESTKL